MLIAITGGIGCGKSVVSRLLRCMGYEVYDCDTRAKELMTKDSELKQGLIALFGTTETYLPDGNLNKALISKHLFENPDMLKKMNNLIHPAVAKDLSGISANHDILFFESAILFESEFDERVHPDLTISVSAPLELRIARIIARDRTTREEVVRRINSQLSQDEKDRRADNVIFNDYEHSVIKQVSEFVKTI